MSKGEQLKKKHSRASDNDMSSKRKRRGKLGPSLLAAFADLSIGDICHQALKSAACGASTGAPASKERFFGVHVAGNTAVGADGEPSPPFVFSDLPSAIQFCKRFKDQARFRELSSRAAAEQFSLKGDVVTDSDGVDGGREEAPPPVPCPPINGSPVPKEDRLKLIGEKSAFRAPKPQELVRLRKLLQEDSCEALRNRIWENPRLLIGSGDNPTVVHEGARYNLFHCAARGDKSEALEELIRLLRSETLFRRLYPEDDPQTTRWRMAFVLGLYLNIPDKTARANTPLHFASSLGHVRCVEVLVRQPECDIRAVNGDGQTAFDVACERATADDKKKLTQAIRMLLSADKVVIPILRDPVDLSEPELGIPLPAHSSEFDCQDPPSPAAERGFQRQVTPTRKSPAAFIGPISSMEARQLSEELKRTKRDCVQIRRTDPDKGIENAARSFARQRNLGWNEYWPFLGCWADLSTGAGLAIFENFLLSRIRTSVKRPHDFLNNNGLGNERNQISRLAQRNEAARSRNGHDSCAMQVDSNQGVPDPLKTSELVKLLYNFINDVLDNVDSLQLPKALKGALVGADHAAAARAVKRKLFISHYEREQVCSHLTHIMDNSADPRLDCLLSALKTTLEGRDEEVSPCSCSSISEEQRIDDEPRYESGSCGRANPGEIPSEPPTHEELSRLGFINGPLPTRTDYQVWLAIEPVRHLPSDTCFPCVHRWIVAMSCFHEDQMRVWRSPQVVRGRVAPHVQTPRPKYSRTVTSPLASGDSRTSPSLRDPTRISLLSRFND